MATYRDDPTDPNKATVADARTYARKAGFTGSDITTAVAIAIAESGLVIKAYNPETSSGTVQGSGSRGLWQIYGAAHPEYNSDDVYDPQTNANAAYAVYKSQGWGAWTTWSSGDYLQYLAVAAGNETSTTTVAKVLPNAVAINEAVATINGTVAGCTQASLVVLAHIYGKAPATTAEFSRILGDSYNKGEASHTPGVEGSQTTDELIWSADNYYKIKLTNGIDGWKANLHKYRGRIPVIIQVGRADLGLGGSNSNVQGHCICVVGWSDTDKLYRVADPNTQEASSGASSGEAQFVTYSEKQIETAQPFALLVPPDENAFQTAIGWVGDRLGDAGNAIGNALGDVGNLKDAVLWPFQAVENFLGGVSKWLTRVDVTTNAVAKEAPGAFGIAEELDRVEQFKPMKWDSFHHVMDSIGTNVLSPISSVL
jgi:hypothetical protein